MVAWRWGERGGMQVDGDRTGVEAVWSWVRVGVWWWGGGWWEGGKGMREGRARGGRAQKEGRKGDMDCGEEGWEERG